jgi:hypothetical protein
MKMTDWKQKAEYLTVQIIFKPKIIREPAASYPTIDDGKAPGGLWNLALDLHQ